MKQRIIVENRIDLPPIPQAETPFEHEAMSDEELGNLLAAFGNHEGKAFLLAAMEPRMFYGATALHNLHLKVQGTEPVYEGVINNQIAYCKRSLEPIGMVTRAAFVGTLQFGLSEIGERVGQPMAALLLDFSDRYELPLGILFGQTSTPKQGGRRSPLTRVKIIKSLLERNGSARHAELAEDTSIPSATITNALEQLAAAELLDYQVVSNFDREVRVEPTEKADTVVRPGGSFTEIVMSIIKATGGEIDTDDLVDQAFDRWPQAEEKSNNFRSKVNGALRLFEAQGLVVRNTVDRDSFSAISLTDSQSEMWEELTTLLGGIQAMDEAVLQRGRELLTKLRRDPATCRKLIGQAYTHSPQANRRDQAALKEVILKSIKAGARTRREIETAYRVQVERPLHAKTASHILNTMVKEGQLCTSLPPKGKVTIYTVVEE